MFTRKDIHPDIDLVLAATARELKMYDNLAPDEINELTGISTHPTFIELNRRHHVLQARAMGHQYPAMTYYQMLRPTVVAQIVDMERHLARSRNPRIRTIIGAWIRGTHFKLEFNDGLHHQGLIKLVLAYPHMSAAQLARHCITNKINVLGDAALNTDAACISEIIGHIRSYVNADKHWAPHPITDCERLYASRWLEIFEQSPQGKNTNGKQR